MWFTADSMPALRAWSHWREWSVLRFCQSDSKSSVLIMPQIAISKRLPLILGLLVPLLVRDLWTRGEFVLRDPCYPEHTLFYRHGQPALVILKRGKWPYCSDSIWEDRDTAKGEKRTCRFGRKWTDLLLNSWPLLFWVMLKKCVSQVLSYCNE